MDAKDVLAADLEHFGESLWCNEEIGEKRFDFFISLVTAVTAGLVGLASLDAIKEETLLPQLEPRSECSC